MSLEYTVDDVVVHKLRHGDGKSGGALHLALDAPHRAFVACPTSTGNTVVHIPEQHLADMAVAVFTTVDYHTKTAVDHFAPANAAAIVDRHPGGTTERVADDILYSHVGTELRTVVDVAGLAEWRVGA